MAKELVISGGQHETRVALLEDDQLVEIYFQRANEYSLAGSIHKGRVTRVLPGMQSAFVDLGLERDTFLYVSDFFEENEEFEKVGEQREARRAAEGRGEVRGEGRGREDRNRDDDGGRRGRGRGRDRGRRGGRSQEAPGELRRGEAEATEANEPLLAESLAPEVEVLSELETPVLDSPSGTLTGEGRGRRRRRGRGPKGGNFPESKYADPAEAASEDVPVEADDLEVDAEPEIILLPGEKLSKRKARVEEAVAVPPAEEPEEADDEEEEEEVVAAPEIVVAEHQVVTESKITPVHVISSETLKAEEEAAVLEEVKEHLAEIERENEEMRDFEEAERIGLDEDEEDSEEEADESAEGADDPEAPNDGDPLEVRAEEGEALEAEASAAAGEEEESSEGEEDSSSVVLPALGYSAHLQNRGERGERGGRRRRRGRGRDREAVAGAAPAEESEVLAEDSAEPEVQEAVAGDGLLPGEKRAERRESTREGSREASREGGREGRRDGRRDDRREDRRDRDRGERPERRALPSITDLLKEGQEVLVQIAKEPLGQKGARITSHIALPGRYCVYMPTVEHTGVSRKIGSDEERARLKRILQSRRDSIPGGFIIRTAGEGRAEADILADMEFLHNLWLDIRRKAESKPAPALIYHDLEIVERVLRDQVGPDFKSIWVDSEEIYESVLRFLERFQPAMVSRVRMYTRQAPIFESFGITAELEKALRPKVWLKSGGYIVINQTEALVAIDINTGKYVGRSNKLEDTIVKTNVEAVKEIVRQVRLRDLGGIIVIDFIDMDERKNRLRVMQALEEAMRTDRAPYKILQFNDFGLVAITRKRVKQSLERTLCAPCPYCEGSGYVKSVNTIIGEILTEAKKLAPAIEDAKDVMLRVNPEVAKIYKSTENHHHEELEEILGRPVMIVSDPLIHQEKFDLA